MTSKTTLPFLDHIDVPETTCRAWQESVNWVSEMFKAPSVLITRFHDRHMEVFLTNRVARHRHSTALNTRDLITLELLGEHVLHHRKPLHVPDLSKDPYWNKNPETSQGMVSYVGMPLFWPKGEAFGVINILDTKETLYQDDLVNLLKNFTAFFTADLQSIYLATELEKANRATLKLKKEMSLFLGIAAHDLKGSLNVLMGCSNMLMDKVHAQTKKEHTYLDLIRKSGIAMQNLLDELMDISRIESMRVPISFQETDLTQLVKDAIQSHQPLAETKGIQINLLSPPGPIKTIIDAAKIDQVLSNLISNAVKFSHRYSVITVSIVQKPEEFVVSVQDQGPGIPMDEQYNLFRPFQTTSIQPPEGETSTGLGLYIARRIVEEHGGRIWVESETGTGSMFTFSLKQGQATMKKSETTKRHAPAKHPATLKESSSR